MRAVFERTKSTLGAVGATLNDMIQINLYLRDLKDFEAAVEVFNEYFDKGHFPARMTLTTDFLDDECLCMIDGVAYKTQSDIDPRRRPYSLAEEVLQLKELSAGMSSRPQKGHCLPLDHDGVRMRKRFVPTYCVASDRHLL